MEAINLSPANQVYVKKTNLNTQNPIQKEKNKNEEKTNKGFLIAGACITAIGIASLAIRGKLKADKAKQLAQEVAEQARKNEALNKIFKNIECFVDPLSETGQKLTMDGLFEKYLHEYSTDGITFYHGTGLESAKAIQKEGFAKSWRGRWTNNFDGAFLTESDKIAKKYARQKIGKPMRPASSIIEQEGVVLKIKIPNGKLAQFTADDDKFLCYGILDRIFKDKEIQEALSRETLEKADFIEYFTKKLTDLGYDGIRTLDAHTGATPIIFNFDKINIEEIIR